LRFQFSLFHDKDCELPVVVEAEPDTVAICHCQQRRTALTCNAYFPKSKVRLEGEHRRRLLRRTPPRAHDRAG
jgi:hypothetical protein